MLTMRDEARGNGEMKRGGERTIRAETNVKDCAESRLVIEGTGGSGADVNACVLTNSHGGARGDEEKTNEHRGGRRSTIRSSE